MNDDNYFWEKRRRSQMITLTAFMIGYALTNKFNSTEQEALGNFFMLIGQTLCTNGAEVFRREGGNADIGNDVMKRMKDVFNEEIDKNW